MDLEFMTPTAILEAWSNEHPRENKRGISMKTLIVTLLVAQLASRIVQAQGTVTYLSNLGQPSAGSLAVGSNSWYATVLFTGTNVGGYSLDSVQLGMADASGNPTGFAAMIYSGVTEHGGFYPGTDLDTLDGSLNPTAAGIYTYTPASSLSLSPGTGYFLVLNAGAAVADGAYDWNYVGAPDYNQNGGWQTFSTVFKSSDGSSWTFSSSSDAQFAINATALPEPGVLSLLGLGGLLFGGGLFYVRRRR
jgi:hypothetical protein